MRLPDAFWPLVTRLGEAQLLLPAALLVAIWLAGRGAAVRMAAVWAIALAAAAALTTASKLAFIGWGVGSAALDFTGVSGHAMFAAAVYPVLLRTLVPAGERRAAATAVAAGIGLAALVAVSRVVTDAHSASEAVAGFVVGGAASTVALAHGVGVSGVPGPPLRPAPRWLPLLLGAWLTLTAAVAPPSRTHDAVTRLALALAGHCLPYTRADLHAPAGRTSQADQWPACVPTLESMNSIAFIGGGNMAGALIGGLRRDGWDGDAITVVEPGDVQRVKLEEVYEVRTLAAPDASLAGTTLVVWAVKPQAFADAAAPCAPHLQGALHLSVMAGIRSGSVARAAGSERVVRAMPNTPALIGQGIAGLYAREAVHEGERELVEDVLAPTGRLLWVAREEDLDAVTALSGSGPAYVFYFVEALMQAAAEMGLDAEAGKQLALATFAGATELALRASEQPHALREQVTSRGGTTQAAIESMDADGVQAAIVKAVRAAQARAVELGDAFGAP